MTISRRLSHFTAVIPFRYSHPSAPSLQSGDLFLLGLFVQDVLDRQEPSEWAVL